MMKHSSWMMIGAMVLAAACSSNESEDAIAKSTKDRLTNPPLAAGDLATQVRGNTAFALDLYQQTASDTSNHLASPHSISIALAMLHGGAAGNTEKEMARALHFDLPQPAMHAAFDALDLALASRGQGAKGVDGGKFALEIQNAIWTRPDGKYLPDYLDLLALYYGAGLHLADFGADPELARQQINAWVAKQTRDRIKELLQQGDVGRATALVLTNTVYLNAAWEQPFEESATQPAPFDAGGSKVSVPMMSDWKSKARYASGAGYQAVELALDGGEVAMLFLVPDAGTFASYRKTLTAAALEDVVGKLTTQTVDLKLPRFTFSARTELRAALEALGMKDAFSDMAADFSRISGATPGSQAALVVKKVIHQAFVQVAEKGAEAAGATAVVMADGGISQPAEPVHLTVDRPFLFVVRDRPTGALLFLGHVVDPTAK